MPYTPFKHIKSDGSIPADLLPASAFLFKYDYEIDVEFTEQDLDSAFKTLLVGADFEISGPDGTKLFAFGFRAHYTISYLLVDLLGSIALSLYTWYTDSQSVTISYPNPPPVVIGDPSGISIPGGGSDYTDSTGIIQSTFESPIFNLDLPQGSTVKITFHNAGFPHVGPLTALQISTRVSGGDFVAAFRNELDGESVVVSPVSSSLSQASVIGRDQSQGGQAALGWSTDGLAAVLRGTPLVQQSIIYQHAGNVLARHLYDDSARYGDPMTLYTGYTLCGAARRDNGQSIVVMTNTAGQFFIGSGLRDDWLDPVEATIPSGSKPGPGVLIVSAEQMDFYWTGASSVLEHLFSSDDGINWT